MKEKNWIQLYESKTQLSSLMKINELTVSFGLVLTEKDAELLMSDRKDTLMEKSRVEFGESVLNRLIETFCDSPYIYQENYVETIGRLQDIFYQYKNDSMDLLSDDELLSLMKEHFNGDCQGSADYLEETVLEQIAREIHEGGEKYLRRMRRMRDVEDDV